MAQSCSRAVLISTSRQFPQWLRHVTVAGRFLATTAQKGPFGGDFPMPGRGRSKTVTSPIGPLIPGERMPAPRELSPEQAAIWNQIIAALPQGWITDASAPLLKELARHIDQGDRLSRDIDLTRSELAALASEPAADAKAEKARATRYRRTQALLFSLIRLHQTQSAAIAHLSTKLRLAKVSQFTRDAESAAIAMRNAGPAVKPWNDWPGGSKQ